MPNIATLTNLKAMQAYSRAAFSDMLRDIERWAGSYEEFSDGLTLSVTGDLAATATAVKASAGKVYAVIVASPGDAALGVFIHLYNIAAGSVTVGTSEHRDSFFVPAGETVVAVFHAGGSANRYGTAIAIASTTTSRGSTAPAAVDRADVVVLYQ